MQDCWFFDFKKIDEQQNYIITFFVHLFALFLKNNRSVDQISLPFSSFSSFDCK